MKKFKKVLTITKRYDIIKLSLQKVIKMAKKEIKSATKLDLDFKQHQKGIVGKE